MLDAPRRDSYDTEHRTIKGAPENELQLTALWDKAIKPTCTILSIVK